MSKPRCSQLRSLAFAALATLAGSTSAFAADKLFVYNFSDYFAEDTVTNFAKRNGIEVRVDFYDSLDVLETRLLAGGSGFDIAFPSATVGERLSQAGALKPIDVSSLKNYKNLDPDLLKMVAEHDPDNKFLVPYMWLTTGVAYNQKLVSERLADAPVNSLDIFFKPEIAAKFQDCGIGIVDAPNEVIPIALNYLGLDPYSTEAEDLDKAKALLMGLRPYIRHMQSGQLVADMASGQLCLALMWSGDAGIAAARAEEAGTGVAVEYAIPKEGTIISFDTIAIPADAPHPDQALAFIDYILEPKTVADITNHVFYANANAAATAEVSAEIRDNPNIYPSAELRAKLFVDKSLPPRQTRDRTRVWTAFRAGN